MDDYPAYSCAISPTASCSIVKETTLKNALFSCSVKCFPQCVIKFVACSKE